MKPDLLTIQPQHPHASRWRAGALLLSLCPALVGCSANQSSFLFPAGPVASADRHLFIIVACVLFFVAAPVLLLTPVMAWRFRHGRPNTDYRPQWTFSWVLEGLIWLPPAAIVVGLAVLVWIYTQRLDPYRAIASSQPPLEVEVVGLNWKWLFIYPEQHIATVNMLAIPVGRPVHLRITSATVMQSFFVPKLAGQIYAMPGMTTQLNLLADRAGQFEGENTQFNGKGFQSQHFSVLAMDEVGFSQWLGRLQASGPLDATALTHLTARSSFDHPSGFSSVPSDLFGQLLHTNMGVHAKDGHTLPAQSASEMHP